MIRALMLIFDPSGTWEKIESSPKNVAQVFFFFLLPLMLLTGSAATWELIHFGVERSTIGDLPSRMIKVSPELAFRYQAVQLAFGLVIVFGGAVLYRVIGQGFHRRHTYTETFTTIAYAISPILLLRALEGLPHFNTWVCWAIGAFLAVAVLYRGIPRIMKPDPSNALGLYLLCALFLLAFSGLAHFFANLVLQEQLLAHGWKW